MARYPEPRNLGLRPQQAADITETARKIYRHHQRQTVEALDRHDFCGKAGFTLTCSFREVAERSDRQVALRFGTGGLFCLVCRILGLLQPVAASQVLKKVRPDAAQPQPLQELL